jgi:hypothetical protein
MKNIILTLSIIGFMFANNVNYETASKAQKEMMQIIWQEAMEAKEMYKQSHSREEIIDNLASTAPREEFIINVDLGDELLVANPEATVYLSTDNQNSWTSSSAYPLNSEGYENTWEAIINNNGGQNISWYISGAADSEALGFDYGRILVSQTPFHADNSFPPPSSHYALLAEDPAGDASSSQDVLNLKGTYSNDKIFMSMGLNGGCCDEGSFFGPWYLYGVAIVNPEAETAVAYAIGYGDGGFGQLTPGLYKITGDLATGEIGGFDYVTSIDTNTSGNNMQASTSLSNIIGDSDWGTWPNSFEGFIALGVTVEASLDGFDVAASLLDQTAPGLMLMTTQTQSGNTNCEVLDLSLDPASQQVAVNYLDAEGNFPWFKKIQLCQENGTCFYQADMIPSEHTYAEGTTFRHIFIHSDNPSDQQNLLSYNGPCILKVAFADGEYQGNQFELEVSLSNGLVDDGSGCVLGDANGDMVLNVLDVVGTVNAVLGNSYDSCIDINGDGTLNVLDIVSLVNLILG